MMSDLVGNCPILSPVRLALAVRLDNLSGVDSGARSTQEVGVDSGASNRDSLASAARTSAIGKGKGRRLPPSGRARDLAVGLALPYKLSMHAGVCSCISKEARLARRAMGKRNSKSSGTSRYRRSFYGPADYRERSLIKVERRREQKNWKFARRPPNQLAIQNMRWWANTPRRVVPPIMDPVDTPVEGREDTPVDLEVREDVLEEDGTEEVENAEEAGEGCEEATNSDSKEMDDEQAERRKVDSERRTTKKHCRTNQIHLDL